MRVLFDLNVLLDLALARDPWYGDARAAGELVSRGALEGCVSAASLPTLYYIARKNAGAAIAIEAVRQCALLFEVVPVRRTTVELALNAHQTDFEDDLQVAAAIEAGCAFIITRDADRFPSGQIPLLTPDALVQRVRLP